MGDEPSFVRLDLGGLALLQTKFSNNFVAGLHRLVTPFQLFCLSLCIHRKMARQFSERSRQRGILQVIRKVYQSRTISLVKPRSSATACICRVRT